MKSLFPPEIAKNTPSEIRTRRTANSSRERLPDNMKRISASEFIISSSAARGQHFKGIPRRRRQEWPKRWHRVAHPAQVGSRKSPRAERVIPEYLLGRIVNRPPGRIGASRFGGSSLPGRLPNRCLTNQTPLNQW